MRMADMDTVCYHGRYVAPAAEFLVVVGMMVLFWWSCSNW